MIKTISIGIIFIIVIAFFSGCLESPATETDNKKKGIIFQSDLVLLTYSNLEFNTEKNVVKGVEVRFLFKNIAGRDLNLNIVVNFYDKFDNLIERSLPKYIDLPKGYEEIGIGLANIINYNGEFAYKVDHVEIIVTELDYV